MFDVVNADSSRLIQLEDDHARAPWKYKVLCDIADASKRLAIEHELANIALLHQLKARREHS